jgi:hypothetical protein
MKDQPSTWLTTFALLLALATGGAAASPADGGELTRLTRLQGSASVGRNRQVVGATVLVRRADDTSRVIVTASDSKGRFRVDGLTDGDYRVEIRREGLRPVVKEDVGLRFPSRAVIEVMMEPIDTAPDPAPLPVEGQSLAGLPRVTVRGEVVERDGDALADVALRFVRTDGRADPILVRTVDDGSFELAELPAGRWRLDTRIVGFLPIWVATDFTEDMRLTVSMVPQPAGYQPSPLELMPLEQPLPPARFRSHRLDEPRDADAEQPSDEADRSSAESSGS